MAAEVRKKQNVLLEDLSEGLWKRTPPLFTALGLCPSLAVTTGAVYGLAMGLSTTAVLVGSTVLISAFRRWIPRQSRIPIYTVAVATLVTMVDLLLQGFLPEIHGVLGLFIPLIVVNCIILGRIESFARQSPARQGAHGRPGIRSRLYVGVDADRRHPGTFGRRSSFRRTGDARGICAVERHEDAGGSLFDDGRLVWRDHPVAAAGDQGAQDDPRRGLSRRPKQR